MNPKDTVKQSVWVPYVVALAMLVIAWDKAPSQESFDAMLAVAIALALVLEGNERRQKQGKSP